MAGERHALCELALSVKDSQSSGNKDSFVIEQQQKQMNSIKFELIRQLTQ